ncbi:MAG: internalization-related competence protein ComEC/Rec2 [Xanthomonadaceae bacterium]|nr:internalization-related competence protein ComEC/Rec2 [Xanthomonadaceae bacterium]
MRDAARMPPGDEDTPGLPALALALLAGAGLCLLLPQLPPWPPVLLLPTCIWLTVNLWRWRRRRWSPAWGMAGALFLGFGLTGLQATSTLARQLPGALEQRDIMVSGRVLDLPQDDLRSTRFLLRVDADSAQQAELRGKRLQLTWYDDDKHRMVAGSARQPGAGRFRLHAGSRWRMTVKLRAPRGLRNPGGFDSEKQALANRIAATGYLRDPEGAREIEPPTGIDAWRERMSARIARAVAVPSSRYVRALALGDTRAIDDVDWERLRAVGVTHLIAISGFHVGMVAGFVALLASLIWRLFPSLGRRLPRQHAVAIAAVVGGLAYAAVAGFALPTVRTVFMIAVVVLAKLLRRAQRTVDVLSLAVIGIVLVDPLSLLVAGFWLSFAGVAWLLWCLPPGADRSMRARLREFFSAQAVATVGLLPLGAVLFGQASLAGPFANLIAIPWWSLVVVPLALTGTALEALHAGMGAWCWRLAAWTFDLAWPLFQRLSDSPLALWWLPEAKWYALPLALFGGFWLLLPRAIPGKPLALLLWLPLLWPDRELPQPGAAELVVLDVGQGLSVLVRTAHHNLLYDMGPARPEGFDAGERVGVPALRALGVTHLDMAIVSHGDNDHAGGFPAVARAFPPALALTPEGAPPLPQGRPCIAGHAWQWDGVRFRFLHPPLYFPYLGNNAGCVLRVESAHGSALLAADIDQVVERDLIRRSPADVRADVIVVAHHGSNGSSDPAFVSATGARYALISAGYGNRYRHPGPATVARWQQAGAVVLTTMDTGAQRVLLAGPGILVQLRRQTQRRLWDAAGRAERRL